VTAQPAAEVQSAEPFIVAQGVRHVDKGGTVALDGVDLEIGTGLFGLLGPNGAGKSTLMKIICTLLVPTEGRISVGGYDVVRDRRQVRTLFGYLPQEFGAWRLHRVEEVLDTLGRLSGMSDADARRRRVVEIIESVGLQEAADRKVKALSGGMVRRLGVAQALVHEPKVLVVDEPTVGLDPEERLRFRQLMVELGRDRVILLSTHIVADLGSGCEDMALIDHGKVEFRGTPSDLTGRAKGSVWEITIPASQEAELGPKIEVVSRVPVGSNIRIRAVCADGSPGSTAQPVEDPTLEEGYLAFMAARGRATASLEEAER
jgi:ABC-type multidrug transport system ATPase subunit